MPRQVDHDERRLEIARAALAVIAAHGLAGLSIRAVAQVLGGSTTLVTHYFPSRDALIERVLGVLEQRWEHEILEIQAANTDPRRRLRALLVWGLPIDDDGLLEVRARLSLHGDTRAQERARPTLATFDRAWLRSLTDAVAAVTSASKRRARLVELLDTVVHGVSMQVGEDPSAWPPARQEAVIDGLLADLDLSPQ